MYKYNGTAENERRLRAGECRCASNGPVFSLAALIRRGQVTDPEKIENLLSTTPVKKLRSDPEPRSRGRLKYIYAVDLKHNINIAPDGDRKGNADSVKHETLFHNKDVLAAGEIWIDNGLIRGINDHSGSYVTDTALETNPSFAKAVLKALNAISCEMSDSLREELEYLAQ